MKIALSSYEIILAAQAGVLRQVENMKLGRRPAHGAGTSNDWQLHIEGCLGEYAVAKFLNVHWSGKGEFRAPDVGVVDVRTRKGSYGHLLLHKDDVDDRAYWFVKGSNGAYEIVGWIKGADGKRDEYWGDPYNTKRPAFWIPEQKLVKV